VVKRITVDLSEKSIDSAIREVRKYKAWVLAKEKELRIRLAAVGATVASIKFSRAIYNGSNDVTVRVDNKGSAAVIYAEGSAVLFIEFGSGAMHGYGHPDAEKHGYGPGTYSDGPDGKGHWDDPNGWWYDHGKHSFGNPPAMAMLAARDSILEQLTTIAKEVFST
jgi:hypothetical protein